MFLHEFIQPFPQYEFAPWQLGSLFEAELATHQTVIVAIPGFFREDRWHPMDFGFLPKILGEMSHGKMTLPLCLLGEMQMPTSPEELQQNLINLTTEITRRHSRLLILGGEMALSYALVAGLCVSKQNISLVSASPFLALGSVEDFITEENYLAKILTNERFSIRNFTALGHQRHLVSPDYVVFLHASRYSALSLGEMMGKIPDAEPRLRFSEITVVDANAVEAGGVSLGNEVCVNGFSSREICQLMLEMGLSQKSAVSGIFNLNPDFDNMLRRQLLVQMVWYWLEGLNIQHQRPKSTEEETYIVMVGKEAYTFKRDVFSDQWYFGNREDLKSNLPCRKEDFELAKKGQIHPNLLK